MDTEFELDRVTKLTWRIFVLIVFFLSVLFFQCFGLHYTVFFVLFLTNNCNMLKTWFELLRNNYIKMIWRETIIFNVSDFSTWFFSRLTRAFNIWLELSREKLYRNELKGNKNYFELARGSSYRGFKLPRVKLQ